MGQLNKKLNEELETARDLALTISKFCLGWILFWLVVFYLLGIFSPESPFSNEEKLGYALAVLIPTGIASLSTWFRFWIIKELYQLEDEKKTRLP